MRTRLFSGLSLIASLASSACAADAPDVGQSEDEQRVKPAGTDPGAGTVTVSAPVALQADNALLVLPGSGSTRVELDRAYASKAGLAMLQLANRWHGVHRSFPVSAGVANRVELGAVHVRLVPDFARQAWGVDGSTVDVWDSAMAAGSGGYARVLESYASPPSPEGRLRPQNPLGGAMVAFPGSYHLAYGLFDGQDVEVQPGKVAVVDLGSTAQRRLGILRAPIRELPDCAIGGDAPESGDATLFRGLTVTAVKRTASGRERALRKGLPVAVPSGGELVFGEYVGTSAHTVEKSAYAFFLSRTLAPVPVAIAARPGDPPPVTTWARLDVDAVEVTMADGSKRTVRGDWSLVDSRGVTAVAFGSTPRGGCRTGTGMDVPFGRYTLRVRYRREGLSAPAIDTIDVDLKP